MKQFLFFSLTICLLVASASLTSAQMPGPPKVMLIVREDIKPGMMGPHSREANNVVQIYSRANSPYHRLAMVPVAGNENEVMYIWGFDSYAEMEKSNTYLDTISNGPYKADFARVRPQGDEDYHSAQRDVIAVLREDLSYNMTTDIRRMRYMRVQTVRVKPGHSRDFEDVRRMTKAAHEKAKVDETMVVYQVAGGAQSGTYLVMIPWASLDSIGTIPHGKSYMDALGDDRRDKIEKIENDSIVFSNTDIYAFAPQLSYVAKDWVSGDPSFWTLKPMMAETIAPTPQKARGKKQ
ncbi:MAG: hypothetical protein ABIO91_02390 [Pyrinomonadaceae bacterium]